MELSDQLRSLRTRLTDLREQSERGATVDAALWAELEVAHEELRVADDELRAQQEEIARLFEGHELVRRQHERTLAMLPVPALVTDGAGLVRSVNAALAVLMGARVARLVGKPVFSLFTVDDRRELRGFLTGHDAVGSFRGYGTVLPAAGDGVRVEVSVTVRRHESGVEATWIFLAAHGPAEAGRRTATAPALAALTAIPAQTTDVQEVLGEAVAVCQDALGPGVQVSVTLGSPLAPEVTSTSSQLAQTVDGAQVRTGQGPCVSAFEERTAISSEHLSTDHRWPRLAAAVPAAVTGCVAAPIEIGDRLVGALNVYGVDGTEITAQRQETAELLAATLGAVVYELELNDELVRLSADMRRALDSRSTIEQAKGIIMAHHGCGPDEAFAHLVDLSSQQERKLREVARSVVDAAVDTARL